MVLAFAVGVGFRVARAGLVLPDGLYRAMSVYLLFAIGLKGGAAVAATPVSELWAPVLVALAAGVAIPIGVIVIARRLGGMSLVDAAALGAHYGSVSVVTFLAAQAYLDAAGAAYEGFMPGLLALLEAPAIAVGLIIGTGAHRGVRASARSVWREPSLAFLLAGLVLGGLVGGEGLASVEPVFVDPFAGVLTLFMLQLGAIVAERLRDIPRAGLFLVTFGVLVPLAHGALGVALGWSIGLSAGGATLLATLLASASYIAAPAAVRAALPEANPAYYLTASLAITFPFNLAVGIPAYHAASLAFYRMMGA